MKSCSKADAGCVRRCRPLLGTFVEIEIADAREPASALHRRADEAFAEIERVHALMNFHDPATELSQLNARGHLSPMRLHPWTREVLAAAVHFSGISNGIFDVTAPHSRTTYRDIAFHEDGRLGFKRRLRIDLSGIAKGFAVDKAAEVLSAERSAASGHQCGRRFAFRRRTPFADRSARSRRAVRTFLFGGALRASGCDQRWLFFSGAASSRRSAHGPRSSQRGERDDFRADLSASRCAHENRAACGAGLCPCNFAA